MDDSFSASCGDSANVENKCQIVEACNSANYDGDSGPQKKRPKTGRVNASKAWNYFVKIGVAKDGKEKCKCKACGKVYTCGSVGTSALNHHIPKCPMIAKSRNAGDMVIDRAEKLEVRKLDQKIVRELMTRMIIQHQLPFQFVEWDAFRAFTKYVSSGEAPCVSGDAVTADVMKIYSLGKDKLRKQLDAISGRVCLSFSCWTSCTSRGYITLTAHYVDENWKLNVKLLNLCHLAPPHDNFELSRKVFGCLKEWGMERKIFSITVDNASTDEHLRNLKQLLCLRDGLLSNGDYFHFKCIGRVLDLMVQASLEVVSDVLHKIRKSVKYVSASNSRLKQFCQCVEEVGIDGSHVLHLDVSARWISTYMMLESAIKYRHAFGRMLKKDMTYSHCPSHEEWERGQMIREFLGIFYSLSDFISRSTYPTSNTYLWRIWKIEVSLKKMKLSEDHKIRDMASIMLDEFGKYLSEYSMILAFACVLDPCKKFQFLEFAYSKIDSDMNLVESMVSNVRKALYALFSEYANKGASTSSSFSVMDTFFFPSTLVTEHHENCEKERQKKYAAVMSQLDLYLEEPSEEYINALDYWKNNSHRYGDLARMARDVLSIPLFTVPSESAFSVGGCILNKYRSCTLSENLQALVCSHNWLFGFSPSDQFGDVIEETRKIDINLSNQDSNVIVFDESENED